MGGDKTENRPRFVSRSCGIGSIVVEEAVCFALIARYFKRLASHLTNIATSVVLPLSELDYYDERKITE